MRLCAELADLAMTLARHAAAKATAELAETQDAPAAAAPPPPAATQPAARPRQSSSPSLRAPALKSISWALLFVRLSTVVRTCIAVETQLAATLPPRRAPVAAPAAPQSRPASPTRTAAPGAEVSCLALGAGRDFRLDLKAAFAPPATAPPK